MFSLILLQDNLLFMLRTPDLSLPPPPRHGKVFHCSNNGRFSSFKAKPDFLEVLKNCKKIEITFLWLFVYLFT